MWELIERKKIKWPKVKVSRFTWGIFIDPSKCIHWNPSSYRQDQESEKSNGMEGEWEISDESNERERSNMRVRKANKRSIQSAIQALKSGINRNRLIKQWKFKTFKSKRI